MQEFVSEPPSKPPPPKETSAFVGERAEEPLRYLETYRYIFRSPDASSNILLLTVCQLIPVVGPMVLYGYQFEIFDSLLRDPRADYPRFDFNRFVDYLKRGVWPFLVYLLLNLIMAPVIVVMNLVFMMGMGGITHLSQSRGDDDALVAVLAIVGFLVFFFAMMLLSVAMMFFAIPLTIAAGISQDIGAAFRFSWFKSFIGKVRKELILSQLFFMVSAPIVGLLGMMLCCIGVYPAVTLVLLSQAHFYFQLYQIFLARGGEPVQPAKA